MYDFSRLLVVRRARLRRLEDSLLGHLKITKKSSMGVAAHSKPRCEKQLSQLPSDDRAKIKVRHFINQYEKVPKIMT